MAHYGQVVILVKHGKREPNGKKSPRARKLAKSPKATIPVSRFTHSLEVRIDPVQQNQKDVPRKKLFIGRKSFP
jgi:hypothetical protein